MWSGLRWTDRTSVENLARELSHVARTIPQVSGSLCKHIPSHPNPASQNPFHQTPVRELRYSVKTARSFYLDCWTLKIKLLSSKTSGTFRPTIQRHALQAMSCQETVKLHMKRLPETCVMVKYRIVEKQIIHNMVFCFITSSNLVGRHRSLGG
jgi:hypothetical protein